MKTRHALPLLAAVVASLAGTPAASAQDSFGSVVGVAGDEIVVLKPAFGQGPATVYVFGETDGGWTRTGSLWSAGTAERGENFARSLVTSDGSIIVGSGDPDVSTGAYAFERVGDRWEERASIPLATDDVDRGPISMQTVMAILSPPARVVTADGDFALVALSGGDVGAFERGPDGAWTRTGAVAPAERGRNDGFGTSMAIRGTVAAIGAPRRAPSGAVYLFERMSSGQWVETGMLTVGDFDTGTLLGATVAFTPSGDLIAGAPAAMNSRGAVVTFQRNGAGGWNTQLLTGAEAAGAGEAFGAALAATDNELWIGVPGADGRRGRIDRFERESPAADWMAAGSISDPNVEAGGQFGASLAIGSDRAVVGAPGSHGGYGLAAIYAREGDAWGEPTWVSSGTRFEPVTGGEVRCEDDEASGFDCNDVDLQSFLPIASIGGSPSERVSDAWGWTDLQTGREYALVGRTGGAALIDVTDPQSPSYLGVIPANPSGARDLKVFRDHLFFTGDGAGAHGLMIFDLTRLRDVTNRPVEFEPDLQWDGIGSAHNLIIDTDAGTAFTVSTSGAGETCGGGLLMIDINEPLSPEFAGCFTDTEGLIFPGRTHDAQCVVYHGPDEDYQGRELCFASNETALRIVDVTDKSAPQPISAAAYPGVAYIHQGWLTEDQRYFYLDDELDELVGTTDRTKTIIWDVTDLDDPVVVGEYNGPNLSTDHNLYIVGDRMYQANYQAGLRVIDISDRENPTEIGYFDTTPYGADPPGFNGAWTAYPFFESGNVLVTSMHEGVFILKPRQEELVP